MKKLLKLLAKIRLYGRSSAARALWSKRYRETVRLTEKTLQNAAKETGRLTWSGDIWKSGDLLYGYYASTKLGTPKHEYINKELIPKPLARNEVVEFTEAWLSEYGRGSNSILSQPPCPTILIAACAGIAADAEYLIETGTYLGGSSLMISSAFKQIYTVEADPCIADCARDLHKSAGVINISVTTGDSASYLSTLSDEILNRSVVYLDAHFSGGPTSKRYGETPLAKELKIVLGRAPIICIDDIRYCGSRGYPTFKEIFKTVTSDYTATIMCDQLLLIRRGKILSALMKCNNIESS